MSRSLARRYGLWLVLTACIALPGSVAGAGEWQVSLHTEETADASGRVRFRQLQAWQPANNATAEVTLAFGSATQVRCRVVAQSTHPFDSVRAAVELSDATAGVNGGYFDENGSPVGLLVSDGRQLHPFAKARLLTGTFFVRAGRPHLQRTTSAPAGPLEAAVQCGPLLVERGITVSGLDDKRGAPRTFVLLTAHDQVAIGIIRETTLAQTAQILTAHNLMDGDRTATALNLDGGSSTGFFGRTRNGPLDRPGWARVADCLVFSPK